MPVKITANYRIVTPMFIGDSRQEASGISPTSVKGALRFWWRALNWGRILIDAKGDEASALRLLHKQEMALFGGLPEIIKNEQTGKKEQLGGQGAFLLRVAYTHISANLAPPTPGIQYLLGQGLYRNGYLRSALAEGSTLDVILNVSTSLSEQKQEQLKDALLALGLLGGLGSRSRRGLGSLALESLLYGDTPIAIPTNIDALCKQIKKWASPSDLPPFTALSSNTRIDATLQKTKPINVLEEVGTQLQLYRSYGQNGRVNGQNAEPNFTPDHDAVLGIIQGTTPPNKIPKRAIFGMPHNYFFSSEFNRIKREAIARGRTEQQAKKEAAAKSKLDLAPSLQNNNKVYGSRRASPLFIHIHQFPDESVVLVQVLIPATFLPQDGRMEFKASRNDSVNFDQAMIDWQDIHTYMDRFESRMTIL